MESFFESFQNIQAILFHKFTNQMNSDFCIRLPLKVMTCQIFFLHLQVVFNHPIVNEDKAPSLRSMGMGIVNGWFAMSRPARVSNTSCTSNINTDFRTEVSNTTH